MKNTRINTRQPVTATNGFVQAMQVQSNFTATENGALTNKSTLNYVLDWFGAGGAIRSRSDADVIALFSKAYAQDKLTALKVLFYFRDVRQGQGERKTFRTIMNWLAKNYEDVARKNLANVPFYGRFDDLYCLVGTPLEAQVFELFAEQLKSDIRNMKKGESISLLAKWLKSENASSKETCNLGRKTREALDLTPKRYRKILSALRKHIDVLEVKMCGQKWSEIDFGKVPSKASLNYRKAFGKHDQERYAAYLKAVEKGEAKINAGAVYPYEILRTLIAGGKHDQTCDLQWKNMPNWLEGNDHYGLVLADTSQSMTSNAGGLPLMVSVSLAIYFAERNVGPFKDVWMTFSSEPDFHKLIGNNLWEKYSNVEQRHWGFSTDLQAAFNRILTTAVGGRVPQSQMPSVLYIISDMEFDAACVSNKATNFEMMKAKYASFGYKLPRVVWWNVAARNEQFPIRADETGTALVSGASPSILKSLLSAKDFDPMSIVYEVTNSPRYDKVVV